MIDPESGDITLFSAEVDSDTPAFHSNTRKTDEVQRRGFSGRLVRKEKVWCDHHIVKSSPTEPTHSVARAAYDLINAGGSDLGLSDSFLNLAENSSEIVARYDKHLRRLYVNNTYAKFTGMAKEHLIGRSIAVSSFAPNAEMFRSILQDVFSSGEPIAFDYSLIGSDHRVVSFECRLLPEFDMNGDLVSVLGIGRNNTEIKESERWLRQTEEIAHIGHWYWDVARQEASVSSEICRIFERPQGWNPDPDELLSHIVDEDLPRVLQEIERARASKTTETTFRCKIKLGFSIVPLRVSANFQYRVTGDLAKVIGTIQDLSTLEDYEARLHDLSFYDSLTGLPNRALFNDRLAQAMNECRRRGDELGLLIISPNNVRALNEIHGHENGLELLKVFARRLLHRLDDFNSLARLDSDEFAIMLPGVHDIATLGCYARELLNLLAEPYKTEDQETYFHTSIGIAVFPLDGQTVGEMIQFAGSALRDAKSHGGSTIRFYSPELTTRSRRRVTLEAALRVAEANDEFDLFYQPKIDLIDGRLVGAEALLRWQNASLGAVPPSEFIGIAEDAGVICSIGAWALSKACLTAHRWNYRGDRELKIAVNLSSKQFHDVNLVETVCTILSLTNCQPQWLEFEITESLLLSDSSSVLTTLETFRKMGITLAIDDFGTGYSSLAYLKRFPIDVLKIDRSFINDVTLDTYSTELVKAIISMARSLRLGLVAEGVETIEQEAFLQTYGCQLGQGYFYSKPLPIHEFERRFIRTETPGLVAPCDQQ